MLNYARILSVGLVAVSLGFTAGCGGSGGPEQPDRYKVTGMVQLNGQPVEKGEITFFSESGDAPGSGKISNGKYEVEVAAGKNKVSIFAPKESGKPDGTGLVATVETIPANYNVNTELEVAIKEGDNSHNFDLVSKTKKRRPR